MQIIMRGTVEGSPSDPVIMLPPSPMDYQVLPAPLSKVRREDLQILSFMYVNIPFFGSSSPLEILRGNDPPDRVVRIFDDSFSVELTELTVGDIRGNFARARKFGRAILSGIELTKDVYGHLIGRRVLLTISPRTKLPRDTSALVEEVLRLLTEDKGCVGDELEGVTEFPQQWPLTYNGFYKVTDPVIVQVFRDGSPNKFNVIGSNQAEFSHSDLLSLLRERISAKDKPSNTVLIVSCGLPDENGCMCPADQFMFEEIVKLRDSLSFNPVHLKSIYLHLWNSLSCIELFRSADLPAYWPTSQHP